MSAVADKLREARALIERGWAQGFFAKSVNGEWVDEEDPAAVCWCAMGAISKACGSEASSGFHQYHAGKRALARAIKTMNIAEWNDAPGRTQAEVLSAFDKAVELAERDQ